MFREFFFSFAIIYHLNLLLLSEIKPIRSNLEITLKILIRIVWICLIIPVKQLALIFAIFLMFFTFLEFYDLIDYSTMRQYQILAYFVSFYLFQRAIHELQKLKQKDKKLPKLLKSPLINIQKLSIENIQEFYHEQTKKSLVQKNQKLLAKVKQKEIQIRLINKKTTQKLIKKIQTVQKNIEFQNERILKDKIVQFGLKEEKIKNKSKIYKKYELSVNQLQFDIASNNNEDLKANIKVLCQNIGVKAPKIIQQQDQSKINMKLQFDLLPQDAINILVDQEKKIVQQTASLHKQQRTLAQIYAQKIKLLLKQYENKGQKVKKMQQCKKNYISPLQLDIAIVMDATNSMKFHLEAAKIHSLAIIKEIKSVYQLSDIQFGFVTYSDHNQKFPVKFINLTSDQIVIKEKINKVNTEWGGDFAEAVLDGLDGALALNWRQQSLKFVFWIGDAPPHGQEYGCSGDYYPKGCPCGKTLNKIVQAFQQKNIMLFLHKCGDSTFKMFQIFRDNFSSSLLHINQNDFKAHQFRQQLVSQINQRLQKILNQVKNINLRLNQFSTQIIQIIKKNIIEIVELHCKIQMQYELQLLNKQLQQVLQLIEKIEQKKRQTNNETNKEYLIAKDSLVVYERCEQIHRQV